MCDRTMAKVAGDMNREPAPRRSEQVECYAQVETRM